MHPLMGDKTIHLINRKNRPAVPSLGSSRTLRKSVTVGGVGYSLPGGFRAWIHGLKLPVLPGDPGEAQVGAVTHGGDWGFCPCQEVLFRFHATGTDHGITDAAEENLVIAGKTGGGLWVNYTKKAGQRAHAAVGID